MKKMICDRTLKDLKADYEIWLKSIQDNLDDIKTKVKNSSNRKDSKNGELDRSIEYEKAQSTTLNFSSILEDEEQLQRNWTLPATHLRRL